MSDGGDDGEDGKPGGSKPRGRRPKSAGLLRTVWVPRPSCPGCPCLERRVISVENFDQGARQQYVECLECGVRYYVLHDPSIHYQIS